LNLELLPGHAENPRWDGNWPRPEELRGLPAGVLISFVDFANYPPGKIYEAGPVVLQGHDGDWREGQRIYRKWKNSGQKGKGKERGSGTKARPWPQPGDPALALDFKNSSVYSAKPTDGCPWAFLNRSRNS
jgi:hypothetical protein